MAAGWTMVVVVVSLHLDPRPPAPSPTAALMGMASASYHGTSEEPLKTLAAAQGLAFFSSSFFPPFPRAAARCKHSPGGNELVSRFEDG